MTKQSRFVFGGAALVLLALLATFSIAISTSQNHATNDVKGRFRERANVSAALTQALFATAASESQAQNSKLYGGAHVSRAALAKAQAQSGGNGGYLAVVDAGARLLALSPKAPAGAAQAVAEAAPQVHAVLRGQPYALSDVRTPPGGAPSLQLLDAFRTPYGPRVLVSGFAPLLLSNFIGGYLAQVPNVKGGHVYALDSHGVILASTDRTQLPGRRVAEPGLLTALRHTSEGSFGARYLASAPVKDSTWRVVLTAPTTALFASVNGSRKWVPWVLFAAFAIAAAIALAMLRGVLASAARVRFANSRLEDVNDRLAITNRALDQRATELARSNSELEQFASIASHDLQEPLRKVQTFAEQLRQREQAVLSDSGQDYLQRMSAAARRMQDLIDDLLRFSRVTTHTRPFTRVDLNVVAREVLDDLEAVISETGAKVDLGKLPTVSADALQMRQLLQNLLSNALKFHRDGVAPVVEIRGATHGPLAELSVVDNGIGFENQYTERIFRVFERLHGRGVYPGTGIGLSLCRKIVERHGGRITAEGRPSEGSTFTVTLPLEHRRDPSDPLAGLDTTHGDHDAGGPTPAATEEKRYVVA